MNESLRGFYSAAQVRELDRRAIHEHGIAGHALMQRAAAATWRVLKDRWHGAARVYVLCGSGNNGGDGYEIARLAHRDGLAVTCLQVGTPPAEGDAAAARAAWLADGGEADEMAESIAFDADVIVDAVFGTGLSRPVDGIARAAIEAINHARAAGRGVLAVDIPSGLDADRGVPLGAAVRADVTVTFIGRKPGLYTGVGPDYAGKVVFDALDVPAAIYENLEPAADALEPAFLRSVLPPRPRSAHKGRHGHVLLIGGERGMCGAILLAGRAALRAGAGLVSVATRADHAAALTAAQPELMCHGVERPADMQALLERATVVAVGPGLGRGDWGRAMWSYAATLRRPLVVDADGLNWLSDEPARRDDWILTPHPGEAARLLGRASGEIQADRVAAARDLQQRYGGVVVLKGAGSLVQGRRLALCPCGNPGMAVGGMGDVLTGVIAGLLAQGLDVENAARAGVLAHAAAGDQAARLGERGLLPSDVLDELRRVMNP